MTHTPVIHVKVRCDNQLDNKPKNAHMEYNAYTTVEVGDFLADETCPLCEEHHALEVIEV